MRGVQLFPPSLVLSLILLMMFAGAPQASTQDRANVEVVPTIPHSNQVNSIAFSPDGKRVLSGGDDRTIKMWDADTGVLMRTFEGYSSEVYLVTFSPDGNRVLSGGHVGPIRVWDAATGALVRTGREPFILGRSVALSTDGTRVLSGGSDGKVKLRDAATGALLRTFEGHSGEVFSVAFSPNGAHVLSSGYDRSIKLWDADSGFLLRTFKGHSGGVYSVAFSADGARVLSGSFDTTIKLWVADTGALLRTFEGRLGQVTSVAFSPDGARVLAGGDMVRMWNADTGALLRTFEGRLGQVTSVAFSPDGASVLAGGADKTVKLWNADTGTLLRTFARHSDVINSVAFSPNGARLLAGGADKTVRLWDASTGVLMRTFEGHSGGVNSVAFSPDGARVLSGSDDRDIKLWNTDTGALLRTFVGKSLAHYVVSVGFSPDGARVLSGSVDVELWDAATGTLLRTFAGHSVRSVAFSPDGARVLAGSYDRTMKLWDASTGVLVRTFALNDRVRSVAFSPDATRVLSSSGRATLWDAATGTLLRTFERYSGEVPLVDGEVFSVAFSPNGAHVLAGVADKTVRLWDADTGVLMRTFAGHSSKVRSVAFSPDGRRIVSASADTTMRVWDAATSAPLATLVAGRDGQWLAITPAGFFAGSGAVNNLLGIVRGLDVTTIDQVHQSLFNPDLVREALAGDLGGELAEAAKVVNLEKVLDSGPAPLVAIASPAEGHQSVSDLVTVTARIEDRGKGVGRIEWRVNGITAAVVAKPAGSGPAHTVTRQLALDPGDNAIEVVAYNGSNLLASLPARITVTFTGPADTIKPRLHILAIGINAYVDKGWTSPGSKTGASFPPLDLATKDAKAFAADMQKAGAGLYDEVSITLALDQDATRDNLPRLVDKVAARIHPRDSFILFAAAHGYSLNGRFYLIPQDYQGGIAPEALATRAIGQDELQDWLANRIKAKRALILLDTCESGALTAGYLRSRTDAPASEAGVGRLHEATGRPVLTAAATGQSAYEGRIGTGGEAHGFFTWAVLDALRNGDTNRNGLIELSELVAHVQSVVPKIAAKMGGRGQTVASEPPWEKQSARFGSRGEDFVVGRRLQ